MADTSHTAWPFFDDGHRALAAGLAQAAPRIAALSSDDDVDRSTRAIVRALGEGGWLRCVAPAALGGARDGLDVRTLCLVREALARESGLADFAFAMQGLGTGAITRYGTDAQRARYLPPVLRGERIAGFAVSERDAGSDLAAMQTRARAEGDSFIIDGEKTWISNAGLADHYVVICRYPEAGVRAFAAFVVDADSPGLRLTERIRVNAPHVLGTLVFDSCRVPSAALIGEPGRGLEVALGTLDTFRPTVGAAALGFARRAFDEAVAWCGERRVAGDRPLAAMQLTQARLADMAVAIDAAALLVYRAAWAHDTGAGRITREAAMAKLFATEAAQKVIDDAVQLLGARGVVADAPVERLYREIRALRIYEGTSEIQRIIIAGQVAGTREPAAKARRSIGRSAMSMRMHGAESATAHVDTFAHDRLPPRELWPVMDPASAGLAYPPRLNCATELLDTAAAAGPERTALVSPGGTYAYGELLRQANRIAHVLVEDLGLVPGNRVLLRGPNNPAMVACWFAVLKAGGIVVCTMPLLRAREISFVLRKAQVSIALTDARVADELERAAASVAAEPGAPPVRIVRFGSNAPDSLEAMAAGKPEHFGDVPTAADDVALIAFTSGTTGTAKGTVHFHRDVLAIADTFSRHVLRPDADDLFCGSPPLAFTFGLGGLVIFPVRAGAATLLLEQASPPLLLEGIRTFGATISFTAPTAYRAMIEPAALDGVSRLRKCVSAGETLPRATFDAWERATGIRIIDGIGATEMLHIFISAADAAIRPGSTGRCVPGYSARIIDDDGGEVADGDVGRLAVRGPTGCRYLDDVERQRAYVQDGWNITGDAYVRDADGYYWYQARTDDMIISGGYNIAGPEVENVLLEHRFVKECAVIGVPDEARGHVVKAVVVLNEGAAATPETVKLLQDHVKAELAPYKYPRVVEFTDALPRTETGKLQRFRLRERKA